MNAAWLRDAERTLALSRALQPEEVITYPLRASRLSPTAGRRPRDFIEELETEHRAREASRKQHEVRGTHLERGFDELKSDSGNTSGPDAKTKKTLEPSLPSVPPSSATPDSDGFTVLPDITDWRRPSSAEIKERVEKWTQEKAAKDKELRAQRARAEFRAKEVQKLKQVQRRERLRLRLEAGPTPKHAGKVKKPPSKGLKGLLVSPLARSAGVQSFSELLPAKKSVKTSRELILQRQGSGESSGVEKVRSPTVGSRELAEALDCLASVQEMLEREEGKSALLKLRLREDPSLGLQILAATVRLLLPPTLATSSPSSSTSPLPHQKSGSHNSPLEPLYISPLPWSEAGRIFSSRPMTFLHTFDINNIEPDGLAAICIAANNRHFHPKLLAKESVLASKLCQWILEMARYHALLPPGTAKALCAASPSKGTKLRNMGSDGEFEKKLKRASSLFPVMSLLSKGAGERRAAQVLLSCYIYPAAVRKVTRVRIKDGYVPESGRKMKTHISSSTDKFARQEKCLPLIVRERTDSHEKGEERVLSELSSTLVDQCLEASALAFLGAELLSEALCDYIVQDVLYSVMSVNLGPRSTTEDVAPSSIGSPSQSQGGPRETKKSDGERTFSPKSPLGSYRLTASKSGNKSQMARYIPCSSSSDTTFASSSFSPCMYPEVAKALGFAGIEPSALVPTIPPPTLPSSPFSHYMYPQVADALRFSCLPSSAVSWNHASTSTPIPCSLNDVSKTSNESTPRSLSERGRKVETKERAVTSAPRPEGVGTPGHCHRELGAGQEEPATAGVLDVQLAPAASFPIGTTSVPSTVCIVECEAGNETEITKAQVLPGPDAEVDEDGQKTRKERRAQPGNVTLAQPGNVTLVEEEREKIAGALARAWINQHLEQIVSDVISRSVAALAAPLTVEEEEHYTAAGAQARVGGNDEARAVSRTGDREHQSGQSCTDSASLNMEIEESKGAANKDDIIRGTTACLLSATAIAVGVELALRLLSSASSSQQPSSSVRACQTALSLEKVPEPAAVVDPGDQENLMIVSGKSEEADGTTENFLPLPSLPSSSSPGSSAAVERRVAYERGDVVVQVPTEEKVLDDGPIPRRTSADEAATLDGGGTAAGITTADGQGGQGANSILVAPAVLLSPSSTANVPAVSLTSSLSLSPANELPSSSSVLCSSTTTTAPRTSTTATETTTVLLLDSAPPSAESLLLLPDETVHGAQLSADPPSIQGLGLQAEEKKRVDREKEEDVVLGLPDMSQSLSGSTLNHARNSDEVQHDDINGKRVEEGDGRTIAVDSERQIMLSPSGSCQADVSPQPLLRHRGCNVVAHRVVSLAFAEGVRKSREVLQGKLEQCQESGGPQREQEDAKVGSSQGLEETSSECELKLEDNGATSSLSCVSGVPSRSGDDLKQTVVDPSSTDSRHPSSPCSLPTGPVNAKNMEQPSFSTLLSPPSHYLSLARGLAEDSIIEISRVAFETATQAGIRVSDSSVLPSHSSVVPSPPISPTPPPVVSTLSQVSSASYEAQVGKDEMISLPALVSPIQTSSSRATVGDRDERASTAVHSIIQMALVSATKSAAACIPVTSTPNAPSSSHSEEESHFKPTLPSTKETSQVPSTSSPASPLLAGVDMSQVLAREAVRNLTASALRCAVVQHSLGIGLSSPGISSSTSSTSPSRLGRSKSLRASKRERKRNGEDNGDEGRPRANTALLAGDRLLFSLSAPESPSRRALSPPRRQQVVLNPKGNLSARMRQRKRSNSIPQEITKVDEIVLQQTAREKEQKEKEQLSSSSSQPYPPKPKVSLPVILESKALWIPSPLKRRTMSLPVILEDGASKALEKAHPTSPSPSEVPTEGQNDEMDLPTKLPADI